MFTIDAYGASELPTWDKPRTSQSSKAQIENIRWKLIRLRDRAILPEVGNSQVYIRLLPQENMMEGFGGCNRLRGHYEADGSRYTV